MAVRRPLYNNSGNIQEMTDAMIDDIKTFCIFKYQTSGAVNLTVDSSNSGNLSSITDSRLQAGAASTSASAFPNEATTAEPSVVNVTWNRITQQVSSVHNTLTADDGKRYPVYFDTQNNIQAMNAQDMKDTFIHPAFDIIFSTDTTTNQAEVYNGASWLPMTVTASTVSAHQGSLSITESQISDLQSYLTAETNDLSSAVVWANVPNANITQASVTQHQAALSIQESQISDLQSYITTVGQLSTHTNVSSTVPNDQQVLAYNNSANQWEPTTTKAISFTTVQRDALSPTDGDLIYNTTDNKFQGRANGAWVNLH